MLVSIRHVFGRVADHRRAPKLLTDKQGRLRYSHAKNQDITEHSYREGCNRTEEMPKVETLHHLQERDRFGWTYTDECYLDNQDIAYALSEAEKITKRMMTEKDTPPRNTMHCQMCDWRTYCRNDPAGKIEDWFGVVDNSDYSGIARTITAKGLAKAPDPTRSLVTSPSGLTAYMQCPRKWTFSYKLGKKPARPTWSRINARVRGTLVHRAVERLICQLGVDCQKEDIPPHIHGERDNFYDKLVRQDMIQFFRDTFLDGEITEENMTSAIHTAIPTAIRVYKETINDLAFIDHIEQRFIFRIPGTRRWLTCQPDLVGTDTKGRLVIIDYKTTSALDLQRKAEEFHARITMPLYAHAVKHGYKLNHPQ